MILYVGFLRVGHNVRTSTIKFIANNTKCFKGKEVGSQERFDCFVELKRCARMYWNESWFSSKLFVFTNFTCKIVYQVLYTIHLNGKLNAFRRIGLLVLTIVKAETSKLCPKVGNRLATNPTFHIILSVHVFNKSL